MMNTYPSTSSKENKIQRTYPPKIPPSTILTPKYLQDFVKSHMFLYLNTSLQQHNLVPQPIWFDPTAPYLTIFTNLIGTSFIESDMWYL